MQSRHIVTRAARLRDFGLAQAEIDRLKDAAQVSRLQEMPDEVVPLAHDYLDAAERRYGLPHVNYHADRA